jgi:hypothetical protein
MPTYAEKNRGRRVLFPLKRANTAAFGLYDRAAGRLDAGWWMAVALFLVLVQHLLVRQMQIQIPGPAHWYACDENRCAMRSTDAAASTFVEL